MYRTRAKYVGAAAAMAAAVLAGCGQEGGMGGQEGQVPPAPPPPAQGQPPQGQDPAAAKAALQGQLDQLLQQNPITFEPDSAQLTQQGQETVTKASELAKQAPQELRYQIVGHVAKVGSPEKAQQLSQERAQAVADKVAQAGISPDRLEVIGKGDAEPKGTPEESRRVAIVVV